MKFSKTASNTCLATVVAFFALQATAANAIVVTMPHDPTTGVHCAESICISPEPEFVPSVPGGPDLTLVDQSGNIPPVNPGGSTDQNLSSLGDTNPFAPTAPIDTSNLTPEQLANLAPAAGGGLTGQSDLADNSIACANAYLQNKWESPAQQAACKGGSGNDRDLN